MLKLWNLNKVFNPNTVNETTVLNDLSLTVNNNDFITIIGSNGAGKSTLMNVIAGNINEDCGNIALHNKSISDLSEYSRSKFIGRVFQNPTLGTSPSMTILENLSLAHNKGKRFGLTPGVDKKNKEVFKDLLKTLGLGLEDKLNVKVGLLSGGQRQSLSLLMSTISNPELLLLDEHTAALDPKTSEIIMEITDDLVRKKNITTLMITHNLNHAVKYGNRLIMLHEGKVLLDLAGREKKNLTVDKLLSCFERLCSKDILGDRVLLSKVSEI